LSKKQNENERKLTMQIVVAFIVIVFSFSACSANVRFSKTTNADSVKTIQAQKDKNNPNLAIRWRCSYYGKKFHGRKTANGETFDMYQLTAAHKTLPFGTVLRVTNLDNQKTVTVRINDRGPFVKNRVLDLSYAAAKEIDLIKNGTAKIEAEIVQ
jgi:rare lipoprotein A